MKITRKQIRTIKEVLKDVGGILVLALFIIEMGLAVMLMKGGF